ncbi:MAG: HAMP domain-containing sensor histidine kinase [Polyangiales bacterium]
MTFVAELRDELLAIERNPLEGREKRVLSANEVAAIRKRCFALFDEATRAAGDFWLRDAEQLLFEPKRFERAIQRISHELSDGLCNSADDTTLAEYVFRVFDVHWSPPSPKSTAERSPSERRELQRIARLVLDRFEERSLPSDLESFCFELRLVRHIDQVRQLSAIGRALLVLAEHDAIEWMLWLESKLSIGRTDSVRVSRELAAHLSLSTEFRYVLDVRDPDPHDDWQFPWSILKHLVELGVVHAYDDGPNTHYTINPTFHPILLDIAQQRQTPLSLVIDTMLAAERDEIITRVVPSAPPSLSATDAQSQHAKMVVHELRNVLTPVKATLSMARDHLEAGRSAEAIPLVDRVEQSVKRLFHFADELSRFTAIAAPQPEMLDVTQVIRDAIASLNGGVKITYDLALATDLPRVVGHRDRLALVVINILRNAAQVSTHASARVRVTAGLSPALDSVRLAFEDDGPGVDDGLRETIFQPGFSLRLGGSGQGLALVRQVVEVEMHGKVECAKGSLGGALFELILPAVKSD